MKGASRRWMETRLHNSSDTPTPDHLLRLVQLVRAHYIEIDVKGKAGRPRTYHGLSFLLLAVVAVTLRTFKGLELWRLLDQDSILRSEANSALPPCRIAERLSVASALCKLRLKLKSQLLDNRSSKRSDHPKQFTSPARLTVGCTKLVARCGIKSSVKRGLSRFTCAMLTPKANGQRAVIEAGCKVTV